MSELHGDYSRSVVEKMRKAGYARAYEEAGTLGAVSIRGRNLELLGLLDRDEVETAFKAAGLFDAAVDAVRFCDDCHFWREPMEICATHADLAPVVRPRKAV